MNITGEILSELANRIKEVRKSLGVSQEEFVSNIGITRSHLSKIESGQANPSEQLIKSVSREYLISEEWLKEGKGNMFSIGPFNQDQLEELNFLADQLRFQTLESHLDQCDAMLNNLNKSLKDIRKQISEYKKEDIKSFPEYEKKINIILSNTSKINKKIVKNDEN